MSKYIANSGSAAYLEQPLRYRLSRISGDEYTRTWVGRQAEIDAIAAAEEPYAEDVEVTGKGATYTCVARYAYDPTGGAEIPEESQEIDTEAVQQSIFTNPTFRVLPVETVHAVEQAFETKKDGATGYQDGIDAINATTANTTYQNLAKAAYDLLLEGAENYENYQFVMNRTRTVSSTYSTSQIDLSTIAKLYTTGQLVAITGNPLLWNVPSVTLTAEETAKNLFAGWRKRVCRVQIVSTGQRQMIEQWALAKWSLYLYALV